MRYILTVFVGSLVFYGCSWKSDLGLPIEEKTKKIDSSTEMQLSSPEALKRFMDSLAEAGISFSVTTETSGIEESVDSINRLELDDKKLETINIEGVKSLIGKSKNKYTLLHFWATWCKPCRNEFPEFIKYCAGLNNTDVILISTDVDSPQQRKKVLEVYYQLGTTIPLFLAETFSKSDLLSNSAQLDIVHYFDKNSNGGLPYNLLIENRSQKLKQGTAEFKSILNLN